MGRGYSTATKLRMSDKVAEIENKLKGVLESHYLRDNLHMAGTAIVWQSADKHCGILLEDGAVLFVKRNDNKLNRVASFNLIDGKFVCITPPVNYDGVNMGDVGLQNVLSTSDFDPFEPKDINMEMRMLRFNERVF